MWMKILSIQPNYEVSYFEKCCSRNVLQVENLLNLYTLLTNHRSIEFVKKNRNARILFALFEGSKVDMRFITHMIETV